MAFWKPARWLTGQKRVAIAEACVIGIVSGLTAVILKLGISGCVAWRTHWQPPISWILLPIIGLVGGSLAGWLVSAVGAETKGSGIPQVKAALGYVPVALNLRVAVVKLLGTLIALGSGLSLGRQGPTIQIGAALAAQLSHWVPTSPTYRRQLICAGAAAGLAAGFNAPIAGMLFVIEELLQDFSGLTLGTAILASFIGAVVSRLLGGQGLNLSMATLETHFSLIDLPFMVLLGLLAGVFGALFSRGIFAGLALSQRLQMPLPLRVGLAGLITACLGLIFPLAAEDNTGLREFLVTGNVGWQLVLIAFVMKFVLTLLAYSTGAPGGIFAPTLVLGSALGCLVGIVAQAVHGLPMMGGAVTDNITTYALAGMGAFFSAVAQVPITSMVIVFEMTADFNLVLPLMIGTAVAYLVSNWVASGSIYSRLLRWQGIELEEEGTPNNPWVQLTASDLMERQVETLPSQMLVKEAVKAFSQSHHRGFPVVDGGKLVGIVTQTDLGKVSQVQKEKHQTLNDLMTPTPVTVSPEASITHVLHLLNRLKISRLPVTEGHRLVGIITRGDIIRAESEQVSGEANAPASFIYPSYSVYQTRAPANGQGRLVVALANAQTTPKLMEVAIAIALAYDYEIECVHIIGVPKEVPPAEARVSLKAGLALLEAAQRLSHPYTLSIHTQIRVAHDVSQTLLEIVKERNGNLLLLGWQQTTLSAGRIFSTVVDTMIRQAVCHVMVVRFGTPTRFERWLIPVAGGPNSEQALKYLPALITLSQPQDIKLCHVSPIQRQPRFQRQQLVPLAQKLSATLKHPVKTLSAISDSIPDTIIAQAQQEQSQVILLGASREGVLSHVINGNVPLKIAQHSTCTLILVRQAASRGLG